MCSGSHCLLLLVRKYPKVAFVCLDSLEYCASLLNLSSIWECANFRFIKGSITSPDLVDYIVTRHKIDVIINFAAQSHVGRNRPLIPTS